MTQPAATQWITLCDRTDLIPFSGVAAKWEQQQVALFYLPDFENEVYALSNNDPFSRANVLARGLVGDLQGEPCVASPLYKQHFSLRTGACLEDSSVQVTRWPARIREGRVEIGL